MDSPLSDADSLSSAGASTEPLPASELDRALSFSPPPQPAHKNSKARGGGNGNESDSTLTDVSSSDNDREEEDEDDERGTVQQRRRSPSLRAGMNDDDEEEDEEPTPRPANSHKRARPQVEDDEEEEEQEEDAIMALAAGAALARTSSLNHEAASRRPLTDEEDEALSSASDDEQDADHLPDGKPPLKKLRRAGPGSTNGSIVSSSTTDGVPRRAVSVELGGETSEGRGEGEETQESAGTSVLPDGVAEEADEEEENDADEEEGRTSPPKGKKGTAKKVIVKGKGARGRGKASSPRGKSTARSDSPLSVVSSSSDEAPKPLPPLQEAAMDLLKDEQSAADDSVDEPLAVVAAARAARGRGARGRGRGRGGKARGGAAANPQAMSRSTSAESSMTNDVLPFGLPPSKPLTAGTSQTPLLADLPTPSGLVDLDTASPALDAPGVNGRAEPGLEEEDVSMSFSAAEPDAGPSSFPSAVAAVMEEDEPEPEPEVEAVPEAVYQQPAKRAPLSAKKGAKGAKGGKKGGKGKEKASAAAQQQDVEWTPAGVAGEEEAERGEGSEGEEDLSDAALLRKRAEAMEALTKIEIQFAQLRDVLYLERMQEVEQERIGIEEGTHPELLHLTSLIELRRDNKLSLAKSWLDGLEKAYHLQVEHNEHALWNRWQDERARLRTRMLEDANGKRRRLEREKRVLDRPKDDSLASLLAPRPPPAVPLHHRRRLGFDGEPFIENEIEWALRHDDVRANAAPKGLEDEAMYDDLAQMGLREPLRHSMYPYEAVYSHPSALAANAYADPRAAAAAGYAYPSSAYDLSPHALQQQQQQAGFGSSFGTLGALPPLPSRASAEQLAPNRPPSNPNLRHASAYSADGHVGAYPSAPAPRTTFSNGAHYPYDLDGEQRLHGPAAWAKAQAQAQHPAYAAEEEQRRRTISAGGALGGDLLDPQQRFNGGTVGAAAAMEQNGGRKTPTGGSLGAKQRLTLDSHMSHRSPKAQSPAVSSSIAGGSSAASTPAAKTAQAPTTGRQSPAAFMSIPTIPPFDRRRHEQRIASQQSSPAQTPAPQLAPPSVAPAAAAPAAPQAAPAPAPAFAAAAVPAAPVLPPLIKSLFPPVPAPAAGAAPPATTAGQGQAAQEGQFPAFPAVQQAQAVQQRAA
ncbi:hypothetical protein JCM8547_004219 [Rhodosporidiobolus lusitaniae]